MPYALLTQAERPGYLMAGLANGDLWETFDGGDEWARADMRVSAVHRVLVGW